jgi:anti-sigma factor RsiW
MVVEKVKCQKALELMARAFDGVLNEEERQTLERHVGSCDDCAREMHIFSVTVELLTTLPKAPVPAGFNETVLASVKRAPSREKTAATAGWLKWALSTGAAAACIYAAAAIETVRYSIWSSLTSLPGFIVNAAAATAPLLRAGASLVNALWTLFVTLVNLAGPASEKLAIEQSILVAILTCVLSLYYVLRRVRQVPARLPIL